MESIRGWVLGGERTYADCKSGAKYSRGGGATSLQEPRPEAGPPPTDGLRGERQHRIQAATVVRWYIWTMCSPAVIGAWRGGLLSSKQPGSALTRAW